MIASHCYPNKNPSISSPPKRPMDFFFFCQRGFFFFFRKEVLEVCIGMDLMSIFKSFSASVMCDTDLFSNYQVGWAFTTWRAFNKRLLASQPSLLQPPFFWRSLPGKLPRGVSRVGCCTGIDDCNVVKFFLLRLLLHVFLVNFNAFFLFTVHVESSDINFCIGWHIFPWDESVSFYIPPSLHFYSGLLQLHYK